MFDKVKLLRNTVSFARWVAESLEGTSSNHDKCHFQKWILKIFTAASLKNMAVLIVISSHSKVEK